MEDRKSEKPLCGRFEAHWVEPSAEEKARLAEDQRRWEREVADADARIVALRRAVEAEADPVERKGLEEELGRWMLRRFEMAIMDMK